MNFLKLKDPFYIQAGTIPIVIGAPHHGTRPNVDADLNTGPLAIALASRLGATAVVVSDLRRLVDVNKNPLGLNGAARHYAIRYQNEMFRNQPRLVIEIHGHESGNYPIELSTGFDLELSAEEDVIYRSLLKTLKQSLSSTLVRTIGITPAIGIYPLDRDVQKKATSTFTFQKIRRARRLAGVDCYGLHIELGPEFRVTPTARSNGFKDSLADAFAASIQFFYEAIPSAQTWLTGQNESISTVVTWHSFKPALIEEKYEVRNYAEIHPGEMETIGALEGDTLVIRNGNESIRCIARVSRSVPPRHIALPARIQRQISLRTRGRVEVGTLVTLPNLTSAGRDGHPESGTSTSGNFVIGKMLASNGSFVWLSPAEIERFRLRSNLPITVRSQPETPRMNNVKLIADTSLPLRTSAVSQPLMDRMGLTLGEIITIEQCR